MVTHWTGRVKLLVLDIDGTLLTSAGTLTPATRLAVSAAQASGVGVTLATGRRLATARGVAQDLAITLPLIVQGGAQIVDPACGVALYSKPLPPHVVRDAVQIAVEEGVQPIVYEDRVVDQRLFTGPGRHDSAGMRIYVSRRPDTLRRLSYDELATLPGALEVAVIDSLHVARHVSRRMRQANSRTLISYSAGLDSYFLEVFHAHCSKADALRRLAAHLNVPMGDVVAVGDNYNDREMLLEAGLGVAMGNAEPQIQAIADRVIRSNDEDGVAALLADLLCVGRS